MITPIDRPSATAEPSRITRRRFLAGAASVLLASLAGAGLWMSQSKVYPLGFTLDRMRRAFASRRFPFASAEGAILKNFAYLTLDAAEVTKFARDYETAFGKKRWNTDLEPMFLRFLLSTDFFFNEMDESKPVHYIALYTPEKTPCINPLADLT